MNESLSHVSGRGIILNIIKGRQQGTILQTVVKHGCIKPGDCFSCGGWSGKVRNIIQDEKVIQYYQTSNSNSILNQKSNEIKNDLRKILYKEKLLNQNISYNESNCSYEGTAANVFITLDSNCDEPIPLGDEIIFYSLINNNKINNIHNNKEYIHQLSYNTADQERMVYQLMNYSISYEDIHSYHIDKIWYRLIGSKWFKNSPMSSNIINNTNLIIDSNILLESDPNEIVENDEIEVGNEIEDRNDDHEYIDNSLKVIIKADSRKFSKLM